MENYPASWEARITFPTTVQNNQTRTPLQSQSHRFIRGRQFGVKFGLGDFYRRVSQSRDLYPGCCEGQRRPVGEPAVVGAVHCEQSLPLVYEHLYRERPVQFEREWSGMKNTEIIQRSGQL